MKKVLILSYFFPPATFTGSYRVYSWAKYLSDSGYYPIIITRNWDVDITEYQDMSRSVGRRIKHNKYENYEVYYLPYKGNLRDRLFHKYGDENWILLRRLLTLAELIIQNYNFRILPYYNLLSFSKKFLKENQDVSLLISSGRPFSLFGFCHKLAKKYRIPWVADYRDDWNTSQWLRNATVMEKLLSKLETPSEKRWLSSSSCHITISESYVKRISDFIRKPGFLIMNGFDEDDFTGIHGPEQKKDFTIFFSGTLYDSQPVEIFIDGYKQFVNELNGDQKANLVFLGLGIEKKQVQRINFLLRGYEKHFEITDRVDKKTALAFLSEGHVYLMFSHTNTTGVTSSKIFDYLALAKPVILCPTDNDILEQIVTSAKAGHICNTSAEVAKVLKSLHAEFMTTGRLIHTPDRDNISHYSRSNQTKIFAGILDKIVLGEIPNSSFASNKQVLRNTAFYIIHKTGGLALLKSLRNKRASIPVACFHSVTSQIDLSYPSISPELFRTFIKTVSKSYDVIPLMEIDILPPSVKKPLILTFDDGYNDFINYALPVIKEFNVPVLNSIIVSCAETGKPFWTQRLNYAMNYIFRNNRHLRFNFMGINIENNDKLNSPTKTSLFVFNKLLYCQSPQREEFLSALERHFEVPVSGSWNIMNWKEIQRCIDEGVAIGSHSMSHDSLITINDQGLLEYEIAGSKKMLEEKLGIEVLSFAYPNGLYNDHCLRLTSNAGYKYAFCSKEKFFTHSKNESDVLLIPRIAINKKTLSENLLAIENFHNIIKNNK